MSRWHRGLAALVAAGWVLALRPVAHAQVLERNLPPAPKAAPALIVPQQAAPGDQDATPIGPLLRGVLILGPDQAPRTEPAAGMDLSAAPRLTSAARANLASFLGRPLSRRLIAQVQAALVNAYRRSGHPFVSVSTPAQELTGGVLQVRLIEFHLGRTTVKGADPRLAAYIQSSIRTRAGDPIDAPDLSEDLDALNHYPFRRVDATFTPGAGLGDSDLILSVTKTRPWSAYAGYSNSGSPSTGWDRYFAGIQLGGLLGRDSLVSNQVTTSADALFDKSRPFNGVSHPQYLSDAASLIEPVGPRALIEATFDWVETNSVSDPFLARQTTFEGRIGYRFALSNLAGDFSGWGQARIGLEAKHQQSEIFFIGAGRASNLAIEVYQAYVGYSNGRDDAWGRWDMDLVAHISPGDLSAADAKPQALLFSKGRVGDVRYAYLGVNLDRVTRLPLGLAWTAQLIGQYSPRALTGTEQMGIGGQGLVRGYVLDDGAYDEAVVLRDELRAPALNLAPAWLAAPVSPYAFVDAGSGRDQHTGHTVSAASLGLGLDDQLARHVSLSLDGAYALNRAIETRAGDWRLETRASVAF